jgi:hypothetical protein
MAEQTDLSSTGGIDSGALPAGARRSAAEAHEPPRITRLGTVAELTLGSQTENHSDGTFPGSIFH